MPNAETGYVLTGQIYKSEGLHVDAGGSGVANANEVDVKVQKNTACGSTGSDINVLGGLLGNSFLIDNAGTGNVLTGEIIKNTATTVIVANGAPGNTADVTQFKNDSCP